MSLETRHDIECPNRAIPPLETVLGHTRGKPLSITVDLRRSYIPDYVAIALRQHVGQWRVLDITQDDCDDDPDEWGFADIFDFPCKMPTLEELCVSYTCSAEGDVSAFLEPFVLCPRLRNLRFRAVTGTQFEEDEETPVLCFLMENSTFPWAQLTTLCIEVEIPMGDVLDILRKCARLENLTFGSPEQIDAVDDFRRISLPRLRTLKVLEFTFAALAYLHAPSLEELNVEEGELIGCHGILGKFIETCRPPLHTARFIGLEPLFIESVLPLLPVLQELVVDFFFQEMTEMAALRAVPRTRSFTLRVGHLISLNDLCADDHIVDTILGLVEAQWQAEERLLDVFKLEFDGWYLRLGTGDRSRETIRDTRLLRSLAEYRSAGLKVIVSMQKRAPESFRIHSLELMHFVDKDADHDYY